MWKIKSYLLLENCEELISFKNKTYQLVYDLRKKKFEE
ncbi:hypothetical protein LEP1GSC073_4094 [Leptospira noguchii str. Cascata]|nr:hypothetical protein LEP1GSC072_1709 [Leptospira noguchii str. Bonito]EMS84623.1 hypothetical protein LEP1GSC073_4094 [Leptospira noguchii str. Cascata]